MIKKVSAVIHSFLILLYLRWILSLQNLRGLLRVLKSEKHIVFSDKDLAVSKKSVDFASKFLPKCSCLIKASAFKVLTSKSNSKLTLVIGIKKNEKFESHAWIENDTGVVYGNTQDLSQFKPILYLD